MLKNLYIKNFVIVRELNLVLTNGLIVLTGETGVGKSVVAGAINIVMGEKVKGNILFDSEKSCIIEITFTIEKKNKELMNLIDKHEIDISENDLFFRKEISKNYVSKSFINGRRVTNIIIKEFRKLLLDFHSQRDQLLLFNSNIQLDLIDKYGNLESEKEKYQLKYKSLQKMVQEIESLKNLDKVNSEKVQLYLYQIQEIEESNLELNEDNLLQKELNLLSHADAILSQANEMDQIIYEKDNSIYDIISSFTNGLSQFNEDNLHVKNATSFLLDALSNLDDAISEIRQLQNIIDLDQERMSVVEKRLSEINNLKYKYKMSLEELITYFQKIKTFVKQSKSCKTKIQSMLDNLSQKSIDLMMSAKKLSDKRKKVALKLQDTIEKNIKLLSIPDASFNIKFDKVSSLNPFSLELKNLNSTGLDEVEFLFSANKGIEPQNLKVAISGGELSRLMLTIKKVLGDKMSSKTIIFDEIGMGIGGKTAEMLGMFISNISDSHQVISITHLPQIASFSKQHFAINKIIESDRTEIKICELNIDKKREEIARMLSGSNSDLALKHADELLKNKIRVKNYD